MSEKQHHLPDEQLVQALADGKTAAFDVLYQRYVDRVYHIARHLLPAKADAEEIVQDTFLKIWTHHRKLDSAFSFKSYLFEIAKNNCYRALRKQALERTLYQEFGHFMSVQSGAPEPISSELKRHLEEAIDRLPPRAKEVFRMSKQEGLSHQEISEQLNISTNTVENHIALAFKRIHCYFSNLKPASFYLLLLILELM